jgi:hypothetical protein
MSGRERLVNRRNSRAAGLRKALSLRLEWGENSVREVGSVEELDQVLDELEANAREDPLSRGVVT